MDIAGYLKAPVPRWLALSTVVVVSAATGTGTYLYLQRRWNADFDLRLALEVEKTKDFYKVLNKKDYATPEEAVEALINLEERVEDVIITEGYDGRTEIRVDDELTEVSRNVFTNAADSVWDPDAEAAQRDPDKPYIIEHDEFYESNWTSVTLTFFEEDGVLSDERDEHIPDIDNVVGDDNLTKFGHGSRDPNVLYVKNERLDLIFEIVKAEGKYTEQVLGFVQHDDSRDRRPRKFHLDDE